MSSLDCQFSRNLTVAAQVHYVDLRTNEGCGTNYDLSGVTSH